MRKMYPRPGDDQIVYLKDVITDPNIQVGEYTIYNDFVRDPREFEKNNVLYHDPVNGDKLKIGKFCSIACGAKFLFTSGNHALNTRSPSFSKNGIWIRKISVTPGTTRATSWWATMCGSDTKQWCFRA